MSVFRHHGGFEWARGQTHTERKIKWTFEIGMISQGYTGLWVMFSRDLVRRPVEAVLWDQHQWVDHGCLHYRSTDDLSNEHPWVQWLPLAPKNIMWRKNLSWYNSLSSAVPLRPPPQSPGARLLLSLSFLVSLSTFVANVRNEASETWAPLYMACLSSPSLSYYYTKPGSP